MDGPDQGWLGGASSVTCGSEDMSVDCNPMSKGVAQFLAHRGIESMECIHYGAVSANIHRFVRSTHGPEETH